MISARKVLVSLFIGSIAAAAPTLAFKPTGVAVRSSNAVVGVPPSDVGFATAASVRGGDCADAEGFHLHKRDVVKVHGAACLWFAVVMFLETLGGEYKRAAAPSRPHLMFLTKHTVHISCLPTLQNHNSSENSPRS